MNSKIDVLEVVVKHNKEMIDKQNEELAEIRTSLQDTAVVLTDLKAKMNQVEGKVDNYSKGINRALWMLGGGFVSLVFTAIASKFSGSI